MDGIAQAATCSIPAVQEVHAGDSVCARANWIQISQAADHYLNAIEAFYEEANRIDRTIGFIESGDIFDEFLADDPFDSTGWYWRLG